MSIKNLYLALPDFGLGSKCTKQLISYEEDGVAAAGLKTMEVQKLRKLTDEFFISICLKVMGGTFSARAKTF